MAFLYLFISRPYSFLPGVYLSDPFFQWRHKPYRLSQTGSHSFYLCIYVRHWCNFVLLSLQIIQPLDTRHEPLPFISWDSYLLGVSIKKGLIKQIRPDQAYVVSKARKGIERERKKAPYLQTTIGGRLRPPIWLLYVRLIGRSLAWTLFFYFEKNPIWNGIFFILTY